MFERYLELSGASRHPAHLSQYFGRLGHLKRTPIFLAESDVEPRLHLAREAGTPLPTSAIIRACRPNHLAAAGAGDFW